jgi:hypothetical protein
MPPKTESRRRSPWADLTRYHILFGVAGFIYLYFCLSAIDLTYIDFGDGNYLYLSWRLSEGDRLYSELPSPQPPLHLFLGSLLVKAGALPPVLVRTFQAMLRIATGAMVWALAREIVGSRPISALAGMIFIWMPEGVWWSRGYQSEPLLIFLQCVQLHMFLRALRRPRPGLLLIAAGAVGSLGVYTNMTAVPYLGLQILYLIYRYRPGFLPFRKRKQSRTSPSRPGFFWLFLLSLGIPCALLLMGMDAYSGGQYLTQIWTRQIGTYPTESLGETFGYFYSSLVREWGDIVTFEGGFVLLAILGVLLYIGIEDRHPHALYILWWTAASLGSIIFVTKGGTVEYIFTLGEPAVAVFSAFFLQTFFLSAEIPWRLKHIRGDMLLSLAKIFLVLLLFSTLGVKGGWLIARTMQNSMSVMEFPEKQVNAVLYIINSRTEQDDEIIAPPFYAYASQQRLAAHLSYDFLLGFAYDHEYKALVKEVGRDPGLPSARLIMGALFETGEAPKYSALAVSQLQSDFDRNPSLHSRYSAISMFLKVNRLLNEQKIPLVITNRRNLVTWVPLLHQPLRDRYQVLDLQVGPEHPLKGFYDNQTKILHSREEKLQFFVPAQFSSSAG